MANIILSPNMGLPVPVPGQETGPQWANDLNSCLTILDAHDHSDGTGKPITPAGMNINSDFSLNSHNLTGIRTLRLNAQSVTPPAATDLTCVYVLGSDLYYIDANGNNVRITQNGSVAGTPGSIANLVAPASAAYVSASKAFVWQSAGSTAANLDSGAITIRKLTASSNGITIQPPSALAADYSITLATAAPAAGTNLMTMNASGQVGYTTPPASGTSAVTVNSSGQVGYTDSQFFLPSAMLAPWPGATAPTGWLLCDGSEVSRTTYANIYAVIGDSCGSGNGSTTFNLPDYRGRFLRMVDGTAGRDPDKASRTAMNPGGNTGNNVGSIQTGQFASHNHSSVIQNSTYSDGATTGGFRGTNVGAGSTSVTTSLTGGNENRPINAYVNYIIKV